MKNINKYFLLSFLSLGLILGGCEKLEDISENPNTPAQVNSDWLLTSAQKTIMDYQWDEWMNGRTGLQYSQYWASTSYTEESRYQIREGVNRTFWRSFYYSLYDLDQAKEIAVNEPGTQNRQAILDIMQAYTYHVLTDLYGAIPYEESLNSDLLSPKYTPQEDVYMDLVARLKDDVSKLDPSQPSFGSGDIIYQGDVDKWKKFANSLLLRIAIRMVDVNPTGAQQIIEDIGSDPNNIMMSNADNALFEYAGSPPNNNPLNEDAKERQDFAVSNVLIDYLQAANDPRLAVYANEAVSTGGYVGMEYGLTNANATNIPNNDVSMPGDAVRAATAPGIFMLYSEVCFIMAEAAARGFNVSGTAQEWYEEGIRSNMNFWGITDNTVIDNYIASQPYSAGNYMDVIGTQKWIAMYMQGLQAWFVFTRMDFNQPDGSPLLQDPADGSLDPDITPGNFPLRMTYPDEESTLNPDAIAGAIGEQGADSKATRLWWDVN